MNKQLTKSLSKIVTPVVMLFLLLFLSGYSGAVLADVWEKWESHNLENQENEGIEEFVWKEGDKNMPEYPENNDLLEVSGSAAYQNYQYLIDGKNLTVGRDGVVRYSIVIRSKSGADNVMHDGIRCTANQIKHYAYGTTGMDGKKKFIPKTNAGWEPFRLSGITAYGSTLAASYFCDHNGVALKRNVIIHNIKYGKGPVDGLYY